MVVGSKSHFLDGHRRRMSEEKPKFLFVVGCGRKMMAKAQEAGLSFWF